MTLMEKHTACLNDLYDERLKFAAIPEMAWWVERLDRKIVAMAEAIVLLQGKSE